MRSRLAEEEKVSGPTIDKRPIQAVLQRHPILTTLQLSSSFKGKHFVHTDNHGSLEESFRYGPFLLTFQSFCHDSYISIISADECPDSVYLGQYCWI